MVGRLVMTVNPNTFPSCLVGFCVDSASTCFSHDADKLCVPIGLSSLSALLLLLSCLLLVYQRCIHRTENPGETITFFYSLLGNLCSTVGAILSTQLHIQVLLGAAAASVDVVHCISCCFPVLLCRNSKAERRLRMRSRRRQNLLAACVLMVVAGGFLQSKVTYLPSHRPIGGRRLMQVTLRDNTEILGYILGLLSFVIAGTSRFPALRRAHRGQMLTRANVISGLLCSTAGALYAAALLLYNTQFGFLIKVMPWLLAATCCVTLDLLILIIHWCKRGTRQQLISVSPDTEILLGGIHTEDKAVMKRQRKQDVHSSAQTKTKNVQKMMEMGRYMDVSAQPAGKNCLNEMMPEEEVKDRPFNLKVHMIRVDSLCSSDTSLSSDLEWDFEEASAQWTAPTAKRLPPHVWPTNPKSFNICICSMPGLLEKTGTEVCDSISSAGILN